MNIIKPPALKTGDTVGVISPSSPICGDGARKQFADGVAALEKLGLKVKFGNHVFKKHYWSAGTKTERIEDFNKMWQDPEVKMLLMTQGGATANHLLDGINYEMVRRNPKIFCGISDGTTLLNAIFAKTGLITFHGPDLLWTFGREMTFPFRDNIVKTLFEKQRRRLTGVMGLKHQTNPKIKLPWWKCLHPGKASGILIGGHTGSLLNLAASGYLPDTKNAILFIEGTETLEQLDKTLNSFRLRGVFGEIAGIIVGWFDNAYPADISDSPRQVSDLIMEVTDGYGFPILEICELGHNVENYIFPIGCMATIEPDKLLLSIDEPAVTSSDIRGMHETKV